MTSRSEFRSRLRAAALALLLLSCPDREPVATPRLSALEEQRFGMAQVRAALFSVAYHSQRSPTVLPWQLSPMPLYEAARFLRDGAKGDEFGESRRRRSAIDLAIGGLELADGVWHVREPNDGAIAILLGDLKPLFDAELQGLLLDLPQLPPPPPPDPSAFALPPQFVRTLRLGLWHFFDKALGLAIASCGKTDPPITIPDTDPHTAVVEVKTTVTVTGQIASIAKALDPQNWDAVDGTTGKVCNPYFEVAGEYERNTSSDWVPVSCPQLPGSQWSGYLFEFFDAEFQLVSQARFSTILAITPPSGTPPNWGFDYELEKSQGGVVWAGSSPYPLCWGEIDTDEGELDAVKKGTQVQLDAVKRLRFAGWKDSSNKPWDDAMNAWAFTTLKAMGGALGEAACCAPLDPTPCSTTGGTP